MIGVLSFPSFCEEPHSGILKLNMQPKEGPAGQEVHHWASCPRFTDYAMKCSAVVKLGHCDCTQAPNHTYREGKTA